MGYTNDWNGSIELRKEADVEDVIKKYVKFGLLSRRDVDLYTIEENGQVKGGLDFNFTTTSFSAASQMESFFKDLESAAIGGFVQRSGGDDEDIEQYAFDENGKFHSSMGSLCFSNRDAFAALDTNVRLVIEEALRDYAIVNEEAAKLLKELTVPEKKNKAAWIAVNDDDAPEESFCFRVRYTDEHLAKHPEFSSFTLSPDGIKNRIREIVAEYIAEKHIRWSDFDWRDVFLIPEAYFVERGIEISRLDSRYFSTVDREETLAENA